MPAMVFWTRSRPPSASSTTWEERRAVSLAFSSTSRIEAAISVIEEEVSPAAEASDSAFPPIRETLWIICSIEADTPSISPESEDAVVFSCSPAAPSSSTELLASSTVPLSS